MREEYQGYKCMECGNLREVGDDDCESCGAGDFLDVTVREDENGDLVEVG